MKDALKAFVEFLTKLFAALAKFLGYSEEFEAIISDETVSAGE